MKINNLSNQIVPADSTDSSQQTAPASQPSLTSDKDTIETPTSTGLQQIITDASAQQAQSIEFSDDQGEVFTPSLTPGQQQNLQQQIAITRQLIMMGIENPTQEQIDAGVKVANDPAAQKLISQQIGVARQLELLGVENITQEQIDAGVKLTNDPVAQKSITQQLGVARQLTLMGVENPTQEQIDAGVKLMNDPSAMQQLQQDFENAREQIKQGKTPDSLSPLLDSVVNTPGDTPFGIASSIMAGVINTPGATPWSLVNSVLGTAQSGTPGTSGSSDSKSGIDPGTTTGLFTSHGQDSSSSADSTPVTVPVTSEGSETASDPSDWLPYPGTSSSDTSSSAVGIEATDVRDDGSVQIVLSDGTSQEFSNFDDAANWVKDQGYGAAQQDSSGASGASGNEGDTHVSIEGTTTVEVEPPAENSQTQTDNNQTQTDSTQTQTDDGQTKTDSSDGFIDPEGYYDMGGGGITDTGKLDMKLAGGGVTDGVNPDLQNDQEPPTFPTLQQQDGGVTEYANPRFAGVIDTTGDGNEASAATGSLPDPYNVAQPDTRPDLESDPPDAPNQPGIDPYANKG